MRTVFLLLLSARLLAFPGLAQRAVCMPGKSAPETTIGYEPGAVDSCLHLDRYKVVLFGEMHNGSFNPEIEYHLITQLNRDHGYRHVFFEMSVSCAWHYNQYLRTGDTSYLSNKTMVANYREWPRFWRRMYEYNRALPDSQQLVFHGVDFERTEVFGTIRELAPAGMRRPASLQAAMDTVDAHLADKPLDMYDFIDGKFIEYDNSGFVRALRFIQEQFTANPGDASSYFGSNYPVIRDIAANRGQVVVKPRPRNKTMYSAMRRIAEEQRITKFVGVFGAQHTGYTHLSALSNAVRKLPGIRRKDVLVIHEIVYNLRQDTGAAVPFDQKTASLNGGCKATILPSGDVPGHRREADFFLIGDAAK